MNSKCKSHPIPLLSEDSVNKGWTSSSYVALEGYFALKAKSTHTHTKQSGTWFLLCISIISLTLRIAKDKNIQIHAAKSLANAIYRTQKQQEDGLAYMEKHSHYPELEVPASPTLILLKNTQWRALQSPHKNERLRARRERSPFYTQHEKRAKKMKIKNKISVF